MMEKTWSRNAENVTGERKFHFVKAMTNNILKQKSEGHQRKKTTF